MCVCKCSLVNVQVQSFKDYLSCLHIIMRFFFNVHIEIVEFDPWSMQLFVCFILYLIFKTGTMAYFIDSSQLLYLNIVYSFVCFVFKVSCVSNETIFCVSVRSIYDISILSYYWSNLKPRYWGPNTIASQMYFFSKMSPGYFDVDRISQQIRPNFLCLVISLPFNRDWLA